MKTILNLMVTLTLVISCTAKKRENIKWEFASGCRTPESIYYDGESKVVFLSCIVGDGVGKDGKGHIVRLSVDGKALDTKWIGGLNAPKGMRAAGGKLWVTDIDRVLAIDIKTRKIAKEFKVPGAKFLNDVAIRDDGSIFVSDSLTSKIHMIKDGKLSTFMEGDSLESPNGLLYKDGKLYVAAWGLTRDWSTKVPGRLYSIDLDSKQIVYITKKPLGNLDGLEINNSGDFLVSDWVTGHIYQITESGKISTVYDGKKGLADIGFIPESDTILIPYMLGNKAIGI